MCVSTCERGGWGAPGPRLAGSQEGNQVSFLPGRGWKPRLGVAAHPAHRPCLWAALLPLTGASHRGRLRDVVSTPSAWMEWTWQSDTEEPREREAEIRREMGRQESHPTGCRTGTGGDRGRETGQGPAGGKTGLEEVVGRGGWRRGGERREGKEELRKKGGNGVRKSWRKQT